MPKYLCELVGTFFFVLLIALAVNANSPLAPLFIGLSLMVLVYAFGWISGGHFNPAVSLALAVRGALPIPEFVPYAIAQIVGAVLAGFAASRIFGASFLPEPGKDIALGAALGAELLFTMLLCIVVINVAAVRKTAGNSYYGAAIGMTVAAAAYGAGAISGGAFNPAVMFGGLASKSGAFPTSFALYVLVQLVGGFAAAMFFKLERSEDAA